MIETANPERDAKAFVDKLQLPNAWPLTNTNDYSSIGINLGVFNIEFIHFKVRFGIQKTNYTGLSGIAFTSDNTLEADYKYLEKNKIEYRIGENIEAHTTITLNENHLYPTFFLVKYHFNTDGWKKRLNEEFIGSNGGKYNIKSLETIIINKENVFGDIFDSCPIIFNKQYSDNEIILKSRSGKNIDAIDEIHLENCKIKIA
jgi:hypothetical protein